VGARGVDGCDDQADRGFGWQVNSFGKQEQRKCGKEGCKLAEGAGDRRESQQESSKGRALKGLVSLTAAP